MDGERAPLKTVSKVLYDFEALCAYCKFLVTVFPPIVHAQEMRKETMPEPDLRQVTVLPKSEWLRIQDSLNHVNKHNESLKEAARQREAMHLRSKEVVKFWSNTIAVSFTLDI